MKIELTKRQEEVLQYVIKGLTNYDISIILNVKSRTIDSHVSAILKAYEVKNRTELTALINGDVTKSFEAILLNILEYSLKNQNLLYKQYLGRAAVAANKHVNQTFLDSLNNYQLDTLNCMIFDNK
jgi:DNA-binding CsgD family transcriptional regulator